MAMRKDAQERHTKLCTLIQESVETEGQEFEGNKWAVMPRAVWAKMLGVDKKTISRLIKHPPIQTWDTQVEGDRCILLRVGEPGKKSPRHMANIMAKMYLKKTGRMRTNHEFGMLVGLAEEWPEGYQVAIFKNMLDDWNGFVHMLAVHVEQEIDIKGNTDREQKFFKYVSISTLRKFHLVAQDAYKTHMQGVSGCVEPEYDYHYKEYWVTILKASDLPSSPSGDNKVLKLLKSGATKGS